MLKTVTFRSTLIAIACAISLSAHAMADAARKIDVPAGELTNALQQLAKQSGAELIYFADQLKGIHTNGVQGEYTAEKAAAKLLEGTRFHVTIHKSGALLISDAPGGSAEVSSGVRDVESFWSVEEIVVTGSHIRQAEPSGAKIITIDRKKIDESGYGRLEDILFTLTQSFKSVSEEFGSNGANNLTRGAEIQLRGLGVGTTLTLVNGHRQPGGGFYGAFSDISTIPTAAIERVEVLPDGASAIYGSDAIGGVVNIILRKDYDGAESRVRFGSANGEADERQVSQLFGTRWSSGNAMVGYQYYDRDELPAAARAYSAANDDLRPFGGSDFRQFSGNPGTILDPVTQRPAYAIPTGQDGTDLSADELLPGAVNYTDRVTHSSILPEVETHSVFASASQALNELWQFSAEAQFSRREFEIVTPGVIRTLLVPSTNPFYVNPFGGSGPVRVAYDFTDDIGPRVQSGTTDTYLGTVEVTRQLPAEWRMTANGAYGISDNDWQNTNGLLSPTQALADANPETALNVFGDGSHTNPATLAALRSDSQSLAKSTVWSATATADGPLFLLPGGAVRLAIGGDHRRERLNLRPTTAIDVTMERNISAAFAELAVPLIGANNALPAVRRLEMSLAGRFEDYSDFGTTFNPRLGLTWYAIDSLRLRGTWGTSFRAPPFHQSSVELNPGGAFSSTVSDPQSSTRSSKVIALYGNNPNLKEETATVWTAGIDFEPAMLDGLRLSASYFDIDYKDKIATATSLTTILTQENLWGPIIARNPSPAELDAICNSPNFTGDCTGTIAAIIDQRVRNISSLKVRGIDAEVGYAFPSGIGSWRVGLDGTYTLNYERAVSPSAPLVDVVDTVDNPVALRLRASASWSLGAWSTSVSLNHAGSYEDTTVKPSARVDSFTTLDWSLGYRLGGGSSWWQDSRVSIHAVNLLDEAPPFVNQPGRFGYDGANATLVGRLISAQLVKAW